jgi:hypothetical protein
VSGALTVKDATPFVGKTIRLCRADAASTSASFELDQGSAQLYATDGPKLPATFHTRSGDVRCEKGQFVTWLDLGGTWFSGRRVSCATPSPTP